jgi:hypothetical protein
VNTWIKLVTAAGDPNDKRSVCRIGNRYSATRYNAAGTISRVILAAGAAVRSYGTCDYQV